MNTSALLLLLLGASLHATWNFFAKKISGGIPFVWLYNLISTVFALPFGIYAWVHNPATLGTSAWIAIVLSAAVQATYCIVLQKGYQESDFSVVYPVARGVGPMAAVLGAIVVLGEMPGFIAWCGIASIICGILLIAGAHRLLQSQDARLHKGIMWGALTGATIAAYTVLDGWAIKVVGVSPVLYFALGLLVRSILLAPLALPAQDRLRQQWQQHRLSIIIVGVLSPLGYTLALFAMQLAPLSIVAPVRELSMLLGTFFGVRLLKEKHIVARMTGAAFMLAGVVMLARA